MNEKTITIDKRGRITLPKSIREAAGILPGDRVTCAVRLEGGILIKRIASARTQKGNARKAYVTRAGDAAAHARCGTAQVHFPEVEGR